MHPSMHRFISVAVVSLFVSAAPAGAATFTYTFDKDTNNFAGTDGWSNAYCADTWTTALNGGVTPKTDDGCTITSGCSQYNNCGYEWGYWANCQSSDPFDNHIQVGSKQWQDYVFTARFKNVDDDTVGFVWRYQNSGQFYLFLMTRQLAPAAGLACPITVVGSRLYRIQNTQAVELAASPVTYSIGVEHRVRITAQGDHFKVELDSNGDGSFGNNEVVFDLTDNAGLDSGQVGFYAYENGASNSQPCANGQCWFDDLEVEVLSLVPDDCDGVSYEGQCDGKNLKYCSNGQLVEEQCWSCCRWFPDVQYYSCGQGNECEGCVNECAQGESGCNSQYTHSYTCAYADDDDCLDRVYTWCSQTGICDTTTGECVGQCEPACAGKQCGSDGCGGLCGQCGAGQACANGQCVCMPDCAGKQCGPDGCGGDCGTCDLGLACTPGGLCECVPDCGGKQCGDNGCGGACGQCPGPQDVCVKGSCVCEPSCDGKECGDDGCGGSCGACDFGLACTASGVCECAPACGGKECGDDGCGGSCGMCLVGEDCVQGLCICLPKCDGKQCGPDTCGGVCGQCGANEICQDAQCVCVQQCANAACGDDGCGGVCGSCDEGFYCENGACVEGVCIPDCADKACGFDGCDGICGECPKGWTCNAGVCEEPVCEPACDGKDCGPDGCGGECGQCGDGFLCDGGHCACVPQCGGKQCGDDACGGSCGECDDGFECSNEGKCEKEACLPDCAGKQCGDDGCKGTCGPCPEGLTCVEGVCEEDIVCTPKASMKCKGSVLYWVDSCGKFTQQAMVCEVACVDDHCVGDAPDVTGGDAVLEPDVAGEILPSGEETTGPSTEEVISFDGKKSGGCTAQGQPAASAAWLLLALLALLATARRPQRQP